MVRANGRSPRGERLIGYVPLGHWQTVTLVAGLRHTGIVAPMVINGAVNGEIFLAYLEQCLAPTLKRGDIVVIDNLPAHKVVGVEEAIEAAGASLRYLPQYSPDLNPIRWCFIRSRRSSQSREPTIAASANGSNRLSGPSKQANVCTFGMQVMHHFTESALCASHRLGASWPAARRFIGSAHRRPGRCGARASWPQFRTKW